MHDSTIGEELHFDRTAVRLREIAVKAMVQQTALNRISIAQKTQTRRSGEEYEYSTGDLVDIYRKPDGKGAKDTTGWRGPGKITDLTDLPS